MFQTFFGAIGVSGMTLILGFLKEFFNLFNEIRKTVRKHRTKYCTVEQQARIKIV